MNSSRQILDFEDIQALLPPPPIGLDLETQKSVMLFRKNIFQIRINKINRIYEALMDTWPSGRPVDFFVALELCNDDIQNLFDKLMDQNFIKNVLSETYQRGIPLKSSATRVKSQIPIEPEFDISFIENKIESEEENEENKKKKNKKKKKMIWEQNEIDNFIDEYQKVAPILNWNHFSSKFSGKSSDQCRNLYTRLFREGKITIKSKLTNHPTDLTELSIIKPKNIQLTAITFIRGNKKVRIGPQTSTFEEKMMLNPIPGFIDLITNKPMEIPALSPDGYALDYNTWLKLLNEKKVNPFTQNQLTSKRQLVILTIDNFNQYKDKIKNLALIDPNQNSVF